MNNPIPLLINTDFAPDRSLSRVMDDKNGSPFQAAIKINPRRFEDFNDRSIVLNFIMIDKTAPPTPPPPAGR